MLSLGSFVGIRDLLFEAVQLLGPSLFVLRELLSRIIQVLNDVRLRLNRELFV